MTRDDVIVAALVYRKLGFDVIPDHPVKKYPVGFPDWQKRDFTAQELKDCIVNKGYGIGIRNQEGLDFDNHAQEARETITKWRGLVDSVKPGLVKRLLIEKTKNGGYHVCWNCETKQGNQKLASRKPTPQELEKEPKTTQVTFIETRGIGGQFVVSPTPGYTTINQDWTTLPVITAEERGVLIDCAKTFNQIPTNTINYQQKIEEQRPGDLYNKQAIDEALDLLQEDGWTIMFTKDDVTYLKRPGKQDMGISATFGKIAPGVFYSFSSNSAPFEQATAYKPFAIYTILKHSGDYLAAAAELAKRYNLSTSKSDRSDFPTQKPFDLSEKFENAQIKPKLRVPSGYPTFDKSTGGFRGGGFYVPAGLKKSGKTSLLMKMLCHAIAQGYKIGYINTELTESQFVERFTAIATNRTIKEVENNADYSRKWLKQVKGKLFYADKRSIQDKNGISVDLIKDQMGQWVEQGVTVIVFDNLTTISTESTNEKQGWQKMSDAIDELIDFTRENDIVTFGVIHTKPQVIFSETPEGVRRMVEEGKLDDIFKKSITINRRPSTADLYGGGLALSQISGGVIFIWRPLQDANQKQDRTMVILEDFRDGALVSEIEMQFQMEKLRFVEVDRFHKESQSFSAGQKTGG